MSSQQRQESLQVYITAYVTGVTGQLRVVITQYSQNSLWREPISALTNQERALALHDSLGQRKCHNPSLWLPSSPGFPPCVQSTFIHRKGQVFFGVNRVLRRQIGKKLRYPEHISVCTCMHAYACVHRSMYFACVTCWVWFQSCWENQLRERGSHLQIAADPLSVQNVQLSLGFILDNKEVPNNGQWQ